MESQKNSLPFTTRDRLLEAAGKIFSRKGYAAASIREIAQESRTTLPSLYHYFGSKEGLFLEVLREHSEKIISLIIDVDDESGSAREKIKKSMVNTYLKMIDHLEFFRLMLLLTYGPSQGTPSFDFEPYYQQFHELTINLIQKGIENGEFRSGNVDNMAWLLHGTIHIAAEDLCFASVPTIDQAKLEDMLDMILDGFSAGIKKV
jgi:AcrR family transcriptional regulator